MPNEEQEERRRRGREKEEEAREVLFANSIFCRREICHKFLQFIQHRHALMHFVVGNFLNEKNLEFSKDLKIKHVIFQCTVYVRIPFQHIKLK